MGKLPRSIDPCPIIEAIFEVRFESSFPGDAIFGIVYNQFKDEYKNTEELPILQLPAAIRNQDPNLRFSPHYKMRKNNFIIQVGPNVFSLTNVQEYCGWDLFSREIYNTFTKVKGLDLIKRQLRMALRYINIFSDINIFEKSNLVISLNNRQLSQDKINLLAEIPYAHGTSNVKLINYAEARFESQIIAGSIVDIDTNVRYEDFEDIRQAIESAHMEEKALFFNMLDDEFLRTLNPVY